MDVFTAQVLLCAAKAGLSTSTDNIADLYKALNSNSPTERECQVIEDEAKRRFSLGDEVTFTHMNRIGKVVDFNTSRGGFYPGHRYPVYVNFEGTYFDDGKGRTFEYSLQEMVNLTRGETIEQVKEMYKGQ